MVHKSIERTVTPCEYNWNEPEPLSRLIRYEVVDVNKVEITSVEVRVPIKFFWFKVGEELQEASTLIKLMVTLDKTPAINDVFCLKDNNFQFMVTGHVKRLTELALLTPLQGNNSFNIQVGDVMNLIYSTHQE